MDYFCEVCIGWVLRSLCLYLRRLHRALNNVFLRVCNTDFVQIPKAADSAADDLPARPGFFRRRTVFLTALMHRQNLSINLLLL